MHMNLWIFTYKGERYMGNIDALGEDVICKDVYHIYRNPNDPRNFCWEKVEDIRDHYSEFEEGENRKPNQFELNRYNSHMLTARGIFPFDPAEEHD